MEMLKFVFRQLGHPYFAQILMRIGFSLDLLDPNGWRILGDIKVSSDFKPTHF